MWSTISRINPMHYIAFVQLSSRGNYLSQVHMQFTLSCAYYYYTSIVTYEGTTLSIII